MPIAVIVDWFGPYNSLKDLKYAAREWPIKTRVLYMALGSHNTYRYIGMTDAPGHRFDNHPKLKDEDNRTFYAGAIVTQGISGPRGGGRPPDLKLAERTLISFLQPKLNKQHKKTVPDDCISIFSCFYDSINETSTNPLPKFPSLVAYNPHSEEWLR